MSLTPQTITLDLNPSFTQMQTVHCSQYDDNIRQIIVKLQDGGTDIDVSSYTIYIEGTKPDKHGFSYPLTEIGSVSGNTVTFYIQLQMCAVPGMTRAEVVLKSGDDRIGSANFMLAVERAGLQDDTNTSDSELAPYINGAETAAQEAAQSASDSEAWAVGQRNGADVDSSDVTYHNNSKYYSDQVSGSLPAIQAEIDAVDDRVDGIGLYYYEETNPITHAKTEVGIELSKDGQYTSVAIWGTNSTIPEATTSKNGWMSATDKTDLTNAKENVTDLQGRVTTLEGEMDTAQEDLSDVKSAVEHLTDNLINVTTEAANPLVITDGGDGLPVKDCVVNIQPNQPNAYDSVWVGGAGKNKLKNNATTTTINGITFTVNDDGSVTVNGTATANAVLNLNANFDIDAGTYVLNGCPTGGGSSTYEILMNNGSGTIYRDYGTGKEVPLENTTTFLNAQIVVRNGTSVNNLVFKPMLRLSSVSDATFAPYSNICPISGWTEAEIHRCGKNLLPNKKAQNGSNFVIVGGETESDYIYLKKGTYTITSNETNASAYYAKRGGSGVRIGSSGSNVTFADDGEYRFYFYKSGGLPVTNFEWFQLELGSTATSYEPYTGTTYSIDLSSAGTVYGGTLDVTTGVLTVDRVLQNLNDTSKWVAYTSSTNASYYYNSQFSTRKMHDNSLDGLMCSCAPISADASSSTPFVGRWTGAQSPFFGIKVNDTSAYTLDSIKALATAGNIQISYDLATPQTYQLTPTEVTTLLKNNTLTANCGTVSLSYYADTKTYIDNAIATAVASL